MFGSIGGAQGIGGPLHNSIGGEDFIRHIGNDKLIYDFHEGSGTTVHDKSREGNNGTLGAGAFAPTWKYHSLHFDGGDYVDLTGIVHGISTGGFTFCFAVDSLITGDVIFDQETTRIYIRSLSAADKIELLTNVISDDVSSVKPLFFQIVRGKSNNLECYVNGIPENKGQSDSTDITYDGTSKVTLGSAYAPSAYITGTMYSFRILNKGLSGIECQQEYLVNKFSN